MFSVPIISYAMEVEDELADYTIRFALEVSGFKAVRLKGPFELESLGLYYGNNDGIVASVRIPRREGDIVNELILRENNHPVSTFDFDIVNAIGQLLIDKVNKDKTAADKDEHGRLRLENSFQGQRSLSDLPIVNIYIQFLKQCLEATTGLKGIPLWPEGKSCAVVLSHDVDMPIKYPTVVHFRFPKRVRGFLNPFFYARSIVNNFRFFLDDNPNDFWLFEDIMREEAARGFTSTFFFCSSNYYSEEGHSLDVMYDIHEPEFRKIFEKLLAQGFEIGLHGSYNAHRSFDILMNQVRELEKVAGCRIKGVRHHYWKMDADEDNTFRMEGEVGLVYSSTLGFNYDPGFRRNLALPFHPFDRDTDAPMKVLVIPVFCMDGALLYNSNDHDRAFSTAKRFIEILRRWNGLGSLDWHVRTSYPGNAEYRVWGNVYLSILDHLANHPDIWVTNMAMVEEWLRTRSARINGE